MWIYARLFLNEESDLAGEADVPAAAPFLLLTLSAADLRDDYGILCQSWVQSSPFLSHLTHILSNCFRDISLCEMGKAISLSWFSEKLSGCLHAIYRGAMRLVGWRRPVLL